MTSIVPDQLRGWAHGSYPLEAATELLLHASNGRFAIPGHPWIRTDHHGAWLDATHIYPDTTTTHTTNEQRLLAIAASLAGGLPVDLHHALHDHDRPTLDVILAAIAHAGGSHHHTHLDLGPHRGITTTHNTYPSLHPWSGTATTPQVTHQ
jgi:hypothetical protein